MSTARTMPPWAAALAAAASLAAAACGDAVTAPVRTPLAVTQVSAGAAHMCALTSEGRAFCWGAGAEGQLGQGRLADEGEPVAVVAGAGTTAFTQVSAGAQHTCALDGEGAAWCWGWNPYYQRGNPTDTATARPVAVVGGVRFAALDAGGNHTCALDASGAAWCWGYNRFGQLGNGTTNTSIGPVAVAGGLRFRQISAGANHTCAVATSASGGRTWCWGLNAQGQLGVGSDTLAVAVPTRVAGTVALTQVSAGLDHTCGVATGGAPHCWGGNAHGQLGVGASTPEGVPGALTPAAVQMLGPVVAVEAGARTTCAVRQNDRVGHCWGRGDAGQLGNGDVRDHWFPQPVHLQPGNLQRGDLLRFRGLAPSAAQTCGVSDEDVLFCWGRGVPGGGGAGYALLPVRVPIGG